MPNQAQRWVLWGAIALLAVLMLACIKIGGPEPVVTPVPASPTPIPPTPTLIPPTATPVPDARPEITSVRLCRGLTDDGRPFAETNTYSEIDPFAVSVQVANMLSRNVVSAHWYQGDAPIGLTEQDGLAGNAYVGMSLEPPGKWIPGDYRVEVSLDGDVQAAQDFAVIGMVEIPVPGGGGGGSKASGESTSYTNARLGFALEYPESWLVDERDAAVQFSDPQEDATALVLADPEPAGSSQQEAEAVFAVLVQKLPGLQQSAAKPQDDDWYGIFFTYSEGGADTIGALLSKVSDGRGYSLLFAASKEAWDTYVSSFEAMWDSFGILGGGGGAVAGGDVLIVGTIVDSETGRGIPNAILAILKEGVSYDQFVNSGNDKSLIYDIAQSDPDGAFTMNVPVRRGASYTVLAVAKGYGSVWDVAEVSPDIPNPWVIRVTLQKQ